MEDESLDQTKPASDVPISEEQPQEERDRLAEPPPPKAAVSRCRHWRIRGWT
jgi:hypothetical protein